MTATVTALIDLASQHGFGYAILIVGLQVVLDRLMPVEFLVSHLVRPKRPAQGGGAHRRAPATRPAPNKRLCFEE